MKSSNYLSSIWVFYLFILISLLYRLFHLYLFACIYSFVFTLYSNYFSMYIFLRFHPLFQLILYVYIPPFSPSIPTISLCIYSFVFTLYSNYFSLYIFLRFHPLFQLFLYVYITPFSPIYLAPYIFQLLYEIKIYLLE